MKWSVFLTLITIFFISSSALGFTAQRLIVPYATVASSYWTGLAIHNESTSSQTVIVSIYDASGSLIGASDCITIASGAIYADLIDNFISETISGRISVYIRTVGSDTNRFSATMFMGNTGSNNPGFGFQTYYSEDYETEITYLCLIL